jgi:WD40 repeat protein
MLKTGIVFFILLTFGCIRVSYCQFSKNTLHGHDKTIITLAFSNNSKYLASAGSDKTIKIWNTSTGTIVHDLFDNDNGETCMAFYHNDKYLMSGSWSKSMKLWDMENGNLLRVSSGHTRAIKAIASNPVQNLCATSGWEYDILTWNCMTGVIQDRFKGHTESIRSLEFSSNGKYLASAGYDGDLKVWNTKTGLPEFNMVAHKFPIECLAFSPDNKYIATASVDNSVKLWDYKNERLIKKITTHTESAYSVDFSPDGKYIASCGYDKKVAIWSISEQRNKYTLETTIRLKSVCFSPDGKYLAAAGIDSEIYLWDISTLNIKPLQQPPFDVHEKEDFITWLSPQPDTLYTFIAKNHLSFTIEDISYSNVELQINREEIIPEMVDYRNTEGNKLLTDIKLHLDKDTSDIQITAKNEAGSITYAEPKIIIYADPQPYLNKTNLKSLIINIPYHSAINGRTTEEMLNALSPYNSTVIRNYIKTKNTTKDSLNRAMDEIIYQLNYNDVFVGCISGQVVKQDSTHYFLIPSDAGKRFDFENLVPLDGFIHKLTQLESYVILYLNISDPEAPVSKKIDPVSANEFSHYLQIKFADSNQSLSIALLNDQNLEKLRNSITYFNDKNSGLVSLHSFNQSMLDIGKFIIKGKDIPLIRTKQ